MTNRPATVAALLGIVAVSVAAYASDATDVSAVANGFYSIYASFHPSDGIPDARARAKLEPFISPALERLLMDGEAAERHFASVTKNMSPPLIEGDLFTSNFEGATAYHVGACMATGAAAHCLVTFGYRSNAKEDAKPVNWIDTVWLVRTANGWRVDDIAYGATWAFGNKGRLKDTLRDAIRDGNTVSQ
jgi:hypothetical protein